MRIEMREEVRRALASEWPAFAANHPRLASALDETILVEPAMRSLADDPEYVEAMATANAVGAGAEVVADIAGRFVRLWLRQLV